MGFLDSLKKAFSGGGGGGRPDNSLYLFIQCNNCKKIVRVRVALNFDLMQEFSPDDRISGYTLQRDVLDDKCFRLMQLSMTFDDGRRVTSQELRGGRFVTEAEYGAQQAETAEPAV